MKADQKDYSTPDLDAWFEYDNAALDMARKGLAGHCGHPLPANMTPEAVSLINDDPEAFQRRVRQSAYALTMSGWRSCRASVRAEADNKSLK